MAQKEIQSNVHCTWEAHGQTFHSKIHLHNQPTLSRFNVKMWNINKNNINTNIKKRNNTFKNKKTIAKHTFLTFKFMLKIRITKKKHTHTHTIN